MFVSISASQIAGHVKGEVIGDPSALATGVAPADMAKEGDLTFAEKDAHLLAAEKSAASLILTSMECGAQAKTYIRVANARVAFAKVVPLFFPAEPVVAEIHPSAVVAASAIIHESARIGPHCVIGDGVRIGARSELHGGNHIGRGSQIGADVRLFPNVVIYDRTLLGDRVVIHSGSVIGGDGYGYVFDAGAHRKIMQVGNVVIHDDVEIGANAAIDRAAMGSTVIGEGTKIDNLVHIAHNVVVGRHCLIMGQVGFAGSTQMGNYAVIASQSGIGGHLMIGNQATVGAKSGVMRDVPDGGVVLGIPAMPDKHTKRQWVGMQQLPETTKRVRALERLLAELAARVEAQTVTDPE